MPPMMFWGWGAMCCATPQITASWSREMTRFSMAPSIAVSQALMRSCRRCVLDMLVRRRVFSQLLEGAVASVAQSGALGLSGDPVS